MIATLAVSKGKPEKFRPLRCQRFESRQVSLKISSLPFVDAKVAFIIPVIVKLVPFPQFKCMSLILCIFSKKRFKMVFSDYSCPLLLHDLIKK